MGFLNFQLFWKHLWLLVPVWISLHSELVDSAHPNEMVFHPKWTAVFFFAPMVEHSFFFSYVACIFFQLVDIYWQTWRLPEGSDSGCFFGSIKKKKIPSKGLFVQHYQTLVCTFNCAILIPRHRCDCDPLRKSFPGSGFLDGWDRWEFSKLISSQPRQYVLGTIKNVNEWEVNSKSSRKGGLGWNSLSFTWGNSLQIMWTKSTAAICMV